MNSFLLSALSNPVVTGDEFPWTLVIFIGILVLSLAAIILLLLAGRK